VPQRKTKTSGEQDIAIVGMACLFAGAPDLASFWANIVGKFDGIGQPDPAWGAGRYLDPDSRWGERIYTTAAGFLRDLYRFNPAEFGIMPSAIDGGEPDQFLALKVARDALIDAGCVQADHSNTGIILGHSSYLHRGSANVVQHGVVLDQTLELIRELYPHLGNDELTQVRALLKERLPPFNADIAPGLVPNVMTGRIANRLDLKGPNYIIDAACASSLLAVQAAAEELRSGRSNLMLAGGVNASIPAEVYMVFTQLGALSRRSRVRPFDSQSDGTLLGEGLGVVVLKRLDDARRDRDRIYAVLKAIGHSSDGKGLGLLAPSLDGEKLAMQRAYEQSGLDPTSVTLIEAHGTGIPLGDKTEIEALTAVLGPRRGTLPRCALGSVKSMIGHCIPAAGIAGLIKVALALHHKVLPPTLCETANAALGLETTPLYLNTEARPWVHPQDQPRRGAVNAFGFGGINTHAVLEEAADEAPLRLLRTWPSELVVFAAADRAGLLTQVAAAKDWIERHGKQAGLASIAATLARRPTEGAQRLAVVAASVDDLVQKLARAHSSMMDAERRRLQTRSGIYFADSPQSGKLAFLFPGEGAQYPNMLSDLALYFPIVRRWFDFWDTVFRERREVAPSNFVYPPPSACSADVREALAKQLYTLEIGSESSFIATQAMYALLQSLEVRPDVIVGHSSGENSALVAAGVVRARSEEQLRRHIFSLNTMYNQIEAAGGIVTGALLAVGAVDYTKVLEEVERSESELHLALDNCPHQTVIYGPRASLEAAAERLRALGGLCSWLPFDRAYHTPLFSPVSRVLETFLRGVAFGPARIPVYSCATAARFPEDVDESRLLAAAQWSTRVRFRETIERMYEDGVRRFVEVGPSGNLTAFVDDILRERDHLAISSNTRARSGLEQLQHLLARLFVNGVTPRLDTLFEPRALGTLNMGEPLPAIRPALPIANTLPYLDLGDVQLAKLHALLRVPPSSELAEDVALAASQAHPGQVEATTGAAEVAQVHSQHVDPTWDGSWLPLISRVLEQDSEQIQAEADVDMSTQRYLRDHILYASHVSDRDPELHGLAVVPLAVSLELLAEAAALIAVETYLVAIENVRAHNWIALDRGALTLQLRARRLSSERSEERIHANISAGTQLLFEGTVVFAAQALDDAPLLADLTTPRVPLWNDSQLYTTGMFHGPLFHSVRHLIAWDDGGMDLELADTPTAGFLYDDSTPALLLNPVLLDAVGHLTAFWIAQREGTDFSSFPSQIARIDLVYPGEQATSGCRLRGRLAFSAEVDGGRGRFLEGNYDCVDGAGRALFRIHGWRDRFFSVPNRFYFARYRPREGWYGDDWSALFADRAPTALVWVIPPFPAGFLDDAGEIWKRVLAHTVLSHEERAEWMQLPSNPKRRSEWLLGRVALKEVVRRWALDSSGVALLPADISVRVDTAGRPFIAPEGLEALDALPQVSLAHAGGWCVAIAASPKGPVGIDLELLGRIHLPDFLDGAFTTAERTRVEGVAVEQREELALRLWCAKEAAAKSLGTGLNGRPQRFAVTELTPDGNAAVVENAGRRIEVALRRHDDIVIGLTTPSQ
jgi:acyl transferase domain-containing protein/phosphopantetheinyl transferase